MRNSILYKFSLTGEVKAPGWSMQVDRDRLAQAIGEAMRGIPVPRPGRPSTSAPAAVLTVCEGGLSVRGTDVATDVPAIGMWASPIAADGFMVLRVLARIDDDRIDLAFRNGRLGLNERSVRAREI